jgi:uncharacterized membrane protein
MLSYTAVALAVFLIINAYFIAIGPRHFISDIFSLLGQSKLLLVGTDIMQVFVRSYGVPLWYPTVISVAFLLATLVLFYLYTNTLKPFIALIPAFVFMLTWHNFLMYSLAYVPLIIILCYEKDKTNVKDLLKNRTYISASFIAMALVFIVLAVYAHSIYQKENTISINSAVPSLSSSNGLYMINGMTVNVTNNASHYENVSFFFINRHPAIDGIFLADNLSGIPPHSTKTYMFHYNVSNVTANSSIYMMAFSTDYITSSEFPIKAG